jgi:hypothetical protein
MEKTARKKSTRKHLSTPKRLASRMTESSFSPISLPELRLFTERYQGNVCKYDLSNAIAIFYPKRR